MEDKINMTEKIEEKIKKAQAVVDEFLRNYSKTHVKSYKCISCKTNVITPINDRGHCDPLKQHQGMWLNGTVELVRFGYGSDFDTEAYLMAICDPCTAELKEKGLIKNFDDLTKAVNKDRRDHGLFSI